MTTFRHLPPPEGRWLRWLGHGARYLTVADESDGRYCLAWGDVPANQGPPPHIQHREDEFFYILRGELEFKAGNQTLRLGPGGCILIRRGTAHTLKNVSFRTAEVLCLNAPAGFDRFQFEAGEAVSSPPTPRPPTEEELARLPALAPKYGIDLLPPSDAFAVPPNIHAVPPGEGLAIWAAGDRYTFKVTGEDSGGQFALWEAVVPPGGGPPPHTHTREEEAFYVLEGELQFFYDDQPPVTAGPGTFLTLPVGVPHRFHNAIRSEARVLLMVSPAGLERMFQETGVPAGDVNEKPPEMGAAEAERLKRAAPRYGIVLGA